MEKESILKQVLEQCTQINLEISELAKMVEYFVEKNEKNIPNEESEQDHDLSIDYREVGMGYAKVIWDSSVRTDCPVLLVSPEDYDKIYTRAKALSNTKTP